VYGHGRAAIVRQNPERCMMIAGPRIALVLEILRLRDPVSDSLVKDDDERSARALGRRPSGCKMAAAFFIFQSM
jgi:hypothetical protein